MNFSMTGKKNVTFKYRWLLNRSDCIHRFYCICRSPVFLSVDWVLKGLKFTLRVFLLLLLVTLSTIEFILLFLFSNVMEEWVSDCCLTQNKHFLHLLHGENKLRSMRWWWCSLCARPTVMSLIAGSRRFSPVIVLSLPAIFQWVKK